MCASLKSLQTARNEGHYSINTGGEDMETHIQSNGLLLLNDFERTRQKQNSRDMAHLAEGVCGICPICDPLHCLLVVMLN